jgi:hypothetical protein
MKRITYTLLDRENKPVREVTVYERDPVYVALETYMKTNDVPQVIEDLNIVITHIDEY